MQVEFTLSFYAPGVKRESRIKKKIENCQLHLKNTVLEIDDIMIYKEFRMVCDWTDTNCNQVNEDILEELEFAHFLYFSNQSESLLSN